MSKKSKKKTKKKSVVKSLISKMKEKLQKKQQALQVITTPSNRRVLRERNANNNAHSPGSVSTPQVQVMVNAENLNTPPPAPQKTKKIASATKKGRASKPRRSIRMKGRF